MKYTKINKDNYNDACNRYLWLQRGYRDPEKRAEMELLDILLLKYEGKISKNNDDKDEGNEI